MTPPKFEKRTRSFDENQNAPASSDYVASGMDHEPLPSLAIDSEVMPMALQRALRAARTPLVPGVDFKPASVVRDSYLPDSSGSDNVASEKSKVDTLSPLESVPPPAPYPLEPPPGRPSVVPPVRLPHGEMHSVRTRSDPPATGLRSDPPPRIPISDRPSRVAYRSDPPPRFSSSDPPPSLQRNSRSAPPPNSSHRGPHHDPPAQRRSWDDGGYGLLDAGMPSAEARRREAETIPADAHSPAHPGGYDPSMPLPGLRAPSFPNHLAADSARQHENSRLRNVAMTMMFVIFIVAGAVAGMRWYVTREDENLAKSTSATPREAPVSRLKLDRLEPNATVAPHSSTTTESSRKFDVVPKTPTAPVGPAGPAVAKKSLAPSTAADAPVIEPAFVTSPWKSTDHAAAKSKQDGRTAKQKSSSNTAQKTKKAGANGMDPKKIDTKTPLIQD